MNVFELESNLFFKTYKRLPLEIERAEGMYLINKDGTKYLDMFGGLAVNSLGYNHPKINQAIKEQLKKYIHLSNYFLQDPQLKLAEMLLNYSGYQRVFFTNSGTEAIEGALKLARKWGKSQNKTEILGLTNSFHGRTMGALSLTERPKYRDGYEPFLANVSHVEFNNVEDLKKKIDERSLAFFIEFVQGEGGINVVSKEFVETLFELKEKYNILVVADEIQAGIGRTGKFFSFEHFGVKPDITVIAKPIGGGLPLGAILGNEKVACVFNPGMHGTTFGGNPVACAAGVAVLHEIMTNGQMENARKIGEYLKTSFQALQKDFLNLITDVRGYGCMLGIELTRDGDPIAEKMLQQKHVLINCTNINVLRFLPPLILKKEHADKTVSSLREIFQDEKL